MPKYRIDVFVSSHHRCVVEANSWSEAEDIFDPIKDCTEVLEQEWEINSTDRIDDDGNVIYEDDEDEEED